MLYFRSLWEKLVGMYSSLIRYFSDKEDLQNNTSWLYNTVDLKWTVTKIKRILIDAANLDGLQLWQIVQSKISSKITEAVFTNLNGF